MPPRLNFLASFRSLAIRPAAQFVQPRSLVFVRRYADDTSINPPPSTQTPPSASPPLPPPPPPGHGEDDGDVALSALKASLPVEEVKQRDLSDALTNEEALRQLEMISYGLSLLDAETMGHKYGLPELPLPREMTMKRRYHPVLEQITNLLMRDGKKSKAQRDVAMILNFLRTSPAPKINPARPLLPGAPPPAELPLDPVTYLTLAIDSVAPLVKIRNLAGLAGGGASLPVPFPLAIRQRRRLAFMWILDLVSKKPSVGSGRTQFPRRVADEIVAIIEGKSALWEKRNLIHKMGTVSRANVASLMRRKR